MRRSVQPLVLVLPLLAPAAFAQSRPTIQVDLDATDAPRKVLRVRLEIPARPGPLTLVYPQWIPGEHGPSGPLANFVDVRLEAGGVAIPWRRAPEDMFALSTTVPAGADRVTLSAQFLVPVAAGNFTAGPSATDELAILSWNQLVMVPARTSGDQITISATLSLPAGWSHATALAVSAEGGGKVNFAPVSLTTLVDSPTLIGRHLATYEISERHGAAHRISIVADSAAALAPAAEFAPRLAALVDETLAAFGARHYASYRWLLALSDHVAHFGLEHHESSDNRREERALVEEFRHPSVAGLLAHEYVHSWNGKHRRPAVMLSPDYQKPMHGELLWIYEGLTQYWATVLPARAGFWTPEYARERLAQIAGNLDRQTGRGWRPLGDTADAAQMLFGSPQEWQAARRGTDFYDESVLVWLEADSILRQKTAGRVSLDDFAKRFVGGQDSPPSVAPYTLADVVSILNALAPHDWAAFFDQRIRQVQTRPPLAGLEANGWRLVYNDTPNSVIADGDKRFKGRDLRFSLGLRLDKDGKVLDTRPDGPAFLAGIVPGAKILAVGGRVYSSEHLDDALRGSGAGTVEFVIQSGDEVKTVRAELPDRGHSPHLEPIDGRPDGLTELLAPRTRRR